MSSPSAQSLGSYPTVEAWLEGTSADHPWRQLLTSPEQAWAAPPILGSLEEILSTLDAASPIRLPSKKNRFRNDTQIANVLNLRLELLVGYLLAKGEVPFEFESAGTPDFLCRVDGHGLWIEATARVRRTT